MDARRVILATMLARATMLGLGLTLAHLAVVPPAGADHHGRATDLFIEVPLDAPTPGVVFPFGGTHHRVPGVVAVNRAPYFCVPHARGFRDRAAFVTHLRTRHGIDDADIPRAVLVDGGQVRYIGD